MSTHYTEQTGVADTTGTGALSQSAETVTPSLSQPEQGSPAPEGALYALLPDPAASGKDADQVDYDHYDEQINAPHMRDMLRGYAPGQSPESLNERASQSQPAADSPAEEEPAEDEEVIEDEEDLFDPTEHTVSEVNDYLEDVDEDERQRVLDAERNSEHPRVGILKDN